MTHADIRIVRIPEADWQALLPELDTSSVKYVLGRTHFTATWRVTLVVVGEAVEGAALARRFGRPGTIQDGLELKEFRGFHFPLSWRGIVSGMPSTLAQYTNRSDGEAFPPKTAEVLEETLREASPNSEAILSELRALSNNERLQSPAALAVKEQADAISLGLEMAGIESRQAFHRDESNETTPALRAHISRRASEAASIRHDASVFGDWVPTEPAKLDVAHFVDPEDRERSMTIYYADKEQLELLTGTDLIYYNEHRGGFILVQYKRMRRRAYTKASGTYYPDAQLREELRRFEEIEAPPTAARAADWRLCEDAFFVKLVDEWLDRPFENKLVRGYYLPHSLVRLLLADADRGDRPKGWSVDGLPSYLSNEEFLMLAKQGFTGTRSAMTEKIRSLINDALDGLRGVVVSVDHTDPERARRPRHK